MATTTQPTTDRVQWTGFERDTRATLIRMRRALSDLFVLLPGGVRRASDLHRTLGVDTKTCWRLHRIASAPDDPLAVGSQVPGRGSFRRIRDQAAKLDVPAQSLNNLSNAYDAFEALVTHYAGDRSTFDMMIAAYAGDDAERLDHSNRRAAFRANSHILGVQSRAQTVTQILYPSRDDERRFDIVALQGHADFKRLRPGASWQIAQVDFRHDRGECFSARPTPLFDGSDESTGFLDAFSSPDPALRVVTRTAGFTNIELIGDTVGLPSAATYHFGHILRKIAPTYRTEEDSHIRGRPKVRTPTEVLHYHLLVDERTFGEVAPETFLLSDISRDERVADPRLHESHLLKHHDHAAVVGHGIDPLHTPELPRYTEMLAAVLERVGWEPNRFLAIRLRTEFPVLPSSTVVQFPLPEPGRSGP